MKLLEINIPFGRRSKIQYFYGPVFSRRLGFSLGVDVIPKKVCTLECVYCQLGRTTKKTIRRSSFVDLSELEFQIKRIIKENQQLDFITFAGSGEPTLQKHLDKIIIRIKQILKSHVPICVITNATLLYRKDVQRELCQADLVIPSLDAPSKSIFNKITRPHSSIDLEKVISGIEKFRKIFSGKIWLEIMLLRGINDTPQCARAFNGIIERIKPDRIQINIPTRPTPLIKHDFIPSIKAIAEFKKVVGEECEIICEKDKKPRNLNGEVSGARILESLKRRPQTISQLTLSLGINKVDVKKKVDDLQSKGKIYVSETVRGIFYHSK